MSNPVTECAAVRKVNLRELPSQLRQSGKPRPAHFVAVSRHVRLLLTVAVTSLKILQVNSP